MQTIYETINMCIQVLVYPSRQGTIKTSFRPNILELSCDNKIKNILVNLM